MICRRRHRRYPWCYDGGIRQVTSKELPNLFSKVFLRNAQTLSVISSSPPGRALLSKDRSPDHTLNIFPSEFTSTQTGVTVDFELFDVCLLNDEFGTRLGFEDRQDFILGHVKVGDAKMLVLELLRVGKD